MISSPTSTRRRDWRMHKRTVSAAAAGVALVISVAVLGAGKSQNENSSSDSSATPAKPDTVHIYIQTVPPRKASVKWGQKNLGVIPAPRPLVVERTRDSGPLDVVIRANGFLPVHTRAYTFSDSRISVKLTPPTEKNTLFGYRQEAPPNAPPNPDGGVAEPPKAQ
jgi:hypothetical protein